MDKEADSASMLLRSELAGRRRSSGTESTPTDKARRVSQLFHYVFNDGRRLADPSEEQLSPQTPRPRRPPPSDEELK